MKIERDIRINSLFIDDELILSIVSLMIKDGYFDISMPSILN